MNHPNSPPEFYREYPFKLRSPELVVNFYAKVLGYEGLRQDKDDNWFMVESPNEEVVVPLQIEYDISKDSRLVAVNFQVPDLDACRDLIIENGGEITTDKTAIKSLAVYIHACDPARNPFGVIQFYL